MESLDEIIQCYLNEYQKGNRISVEDAIAEHPEFAEEIHSLLPTIFLMEKGQSGESERNPEQTSFNIDISEHLLPYRLVREIGRGGMGVVYEAIDDNNGQRVAIKFMNVRENKGEAAIRRFRREVKMMTRMHHTNIVPVLKSGSHKGSLYYVMRYVDGISLDRFFSKYLVRKYLRSEETPAGTQIYIVKVHPENHNSFRNTKQQSSFSVKSFLAHFTNENTGKFIDPVDWYRLVCQLGVQICDALQYAHSHGILHRDIKPSNLILEENGTIWVADFGLAKPMLDEGLTTNTGHPIGTLQYMAPESVDGLFLPQSDLFSLGLTLYELLAQTPAYDELAYSKMIRQITDASVPPLRKTDPRIPAKLESIIMKATEKSPKKRYQTAKELGNDLRNFLDDRPIMAKTQYRSLLVYWFEKHRYVLAGLILMVLALVFYSVHSSVSNIHTRQFLKEKEILLAEKEREVQLANTNLYIAMDAFNDIYSLYQKNRMELNGKIKLDSLIAPSPTDSSLTANEIAILNITLKFYGRLVEENKNNAPLLIRSAVTHLRIAYFKRIAGNDEKIMNDCYVSKKLFLEGISISDKKEYDTIVYVAAFVNFIRYYSGTSTPKSFCEDFIDPLIERVANIPDTPEFRQDRSLELALLYRIKIITKLKEIFKDCYIFDNINNIQTDLKDQVKMIIRKNAPQITEIDSILKKSETLTQILQDQYATEDSSHAAISLIKSLRGLYFMLIGQPEKAYSCLTDSIKKAEDLLIKNPANPRAQYFLGQSLIQYALAVRCDDSNSGKERQISVIDRAVRECSHLHQKYPKCSAYAALCFSAVYTQVTAYHYWNDSRKAEELYRIAKETFDKFSLDYVYFDGGKYYFPLYYGYASILIENEKYNMAEAIFNEMDLCFSKMIEKGKLEEKWFQKLHNLRSEMDKKRRVKPTPKASSSDE